jgi:vitamin B12 transporter
MIRFILLPVLATGFLSPVLAAEPTRAEPVVVTAERHAQTANEALASVSVITREDIDNSQAQDLVDLLRSEAGVDIVRNGGPGQVTSLFLRGTNSNHTLILIDGVRASAATTGSFPFERISLADIDHIEIVRGPRAVLYGSEAVGGVIQIFTRQAKRETLRVKAGSFGTVGASAATGFGDRTRTHIAADWQQATGFSATNANSGAYYYPDNDGYTRRTLTARVDSPLSTRTRVALSNWSAVDDLEFDQGTEHSENFVTSVRLNNATTGRWSQTFILGNVIDHLRTDDGSISRIDTDRTGIEWQNDISAGSRSSITAGLSYYQERARNDAAPFDDTISNQAAFALWRNRIGKGDLELGARADLHSAFGQHNSGQIAWGHGLGRHHRFYVSCGTAFKAPDQNELYHPGYGGFFAGNPALQPETSTTTEAGIKFHWKHTRLNTSVYNTDVTNLIAYQGTNSQAINIGRASIQGAEITLDLPLGSWSSTGSLTVQRARDASTGEALLRRPDAKMALQLQRRFSGGMHLGLELLAANQHEDISNITYSRITVPGYVVLNLAARKPLPGGWSLEGRLENLTNTKYEVVSGYNTTPLSLFVGLRYTPRGKPS